MTPEKRARQTMQLIEQGRKINLPPLVLVQMITSEICSAEAAVRASIQRQVYSWVERKLEYSSVDAKKLADHLTRDALRQPSARPRPREGMTDEG